MHPCWIQFGPIFGRVAQARTAQSVANQAPSGQKPRLALCLGQFEGRKPPEVWIGTEKKPVDLQLGPCGPRYGQFSVSDHGTQFGPKQARIQPTTDTEGQKGTQQKGSPRVARMGSVHERGHQTTPAPVSEPSVPLVVNLGRSGPGPVRAEIMHFGPTAVQCGRKRRPPGRKRIPKMVPWAAKTLLGGSGTPMGCLSDFWCSLRAGLVQVGFVPLGACGGALRAQNTRSGAQGGHTGGVGVCGPRTCPGG